MQLNKSILYMYIFEYSFLSFQAATGVRGVTARTLPAATYPSDWSLR